MHRLILIHHAVQGVIIRTRALDSQSFASQHRSGRWSSITKVTSEQRQQLIYLGPRLQVLGEEIRWIHFTAYFAEFEVSLPEPLLNPQGVAFYICRSFPKPWRPQIPMAADESVHTLAGSFRPKSAIRALWPSAMPAARTTP